MSKWKINHPGRTGWNYQKTHKGISARKKRKPEEEIARTAAEFRRAVDFVAALWHNNLRFASEASLRAYLNRNGRLRGIRGNALKQNSADLLLAATPDVAISMVLLDDLLQRGPWEPVFRRLHVDQPTTWTWDSR